MRQGKTIPLEKVWLTSTEAARYLGVSLDFIRSVRDSGRIQFYKPLGNKMVFFKKQDIDKFVEKGRQL